MGQVILTAPGGATATQKGTAEGAAIVFTQFPPNAETCTPNDAVEFDQPSAIKVDKGGAGGTLVVVPWGGQTALTFNVEPGDYAEVMVKKVMAASTATGIIRSW